MSLSPDDLSTLVHNIKDWGMALGFQQVGISDTNLSSAEQHLTAWLDKGFHGDMAYMQQHGFKRSRPAELLPGTCSVISVRMDYLPESAAAMQSALETPLQAYISRYALGRDYHKLLRRRLQQLADRLSAEIGPFGYRAFVDSAPRFRESVSGKSRFRVDRQAQQCD